MDLNIDYSKEYFSKELFNMQINYLKNCTKDVYIYGLPNTKMTDSLKKTLTDNFITYKILDAFDVTCVKQIIDKGGAVLIYGCDFVGFSDKFHKSINWLIKSCNNRDIDIIIPNGYWTKSLDDGELISQWIGISSKYIKDNYELFNETYNLLSDDFSRLLMEDYLYSQIMLDGTNLEKYWKNKSNDYDYDLLLQNYKKGQDISNSIIIEGGAFDGKSIIEITNSIDEPISMIAIECDDINYEKLCSNIKNYKNIKPYKSAVWNKETKFMVVHNDSASYLKEVDSSYSGQAINAIDIDSLVSKESNKEVFALLLDIEGSELKALEGAKKTIKNKKTNIAVRVYHKKEDLITIPQYLYKLNNDYKFYLRYNHQMKARNGHETTLYAIAKY